MNPFITFYVDDIQFIYYKEGTLHSLSPYQLSDIVRFCCSTRLLTFSHRVWSPLFALFDDVIDVGVFDDVIAIGVFSFFFFLWWVNEVSHQTSDVAQVRCLV